MSSEIAGTTSPDDKCAPTETSDRGSNPSSNPKKRKMTASQGFNEAECALQKRKALANQLYNDAKRAMQQAEKALQDAAQKCLDITLEENKLKNEVEVAKAICYIEISDDESESDTEEAPPAVGTPPTPLPSTPPVSYTHLTLPTIYSV